jgi:hypothetical protein
VKNIIQTNDTSRDLLSNRIATGSLYGIPIVALIASGFIQLDQGWRAAVWTASLMVMGGACIANALRCGRVHCYVTGPFLLAMAAVALLVGLGVIHGSQDLWNVLGLIVLIGMILTYWLPERLCGKYRQRHA